MSENENYAHDKDGNEVSCGIIFQNNAGEILGCHSTGKAWLRATFDLPKGHLDIGENALQCAMRETKEETGWDISSNQYFLKNVKDLGTFDYVKDKNIHLFYINMEIPDTHTLHCESYFTNENGKQIPEVNGFAMIKADELNWFFHSLERVLRGIPEIQTC